MIEEKVLDGRGKDLFIRKVNVVTDLLIHHLSSPLNQVKVGRIRGKMAQFDAQVGGYDLRGFADAIRALVQNDVECGKPGSRITSAQPHEVFGQGL